jgi:PAS domain S-box-containing protein
MGLQAPDPESLNHKLTEAQLAAEQSRRRYADLYDFAPVAYLTLDPAGKITAANLTTTVLLGVPRGRLIGMPLAQLVRGSDAARFAEHLRHCFERRSEIVTELAFPGRDRGPVCVQVSSTPIFDEGDNVLECRTTLTDISALKRGEERLALLSEASRLLGATLDQEVGPAVVLRLAVQRFADIALLDLADADGTLRRVHQAACPDAEPPPSRSLPGPFQLKVFTSHQPMFLPDCTRATLPEKIDGELGWLVRRGGASTVMMLPIVSRGTAFGVLTLVGTHRVRSFTPADLTTGEDLAARLATTLDNARLHQQAREAVRAREEILAAVSHDLKNPLYALMLSMMGAVERAPEVERRRGWPRMDRVKRIARQMSRMVGDLADFCGPDSEPFALERKTWTVTALLDEVVDALVPLAKEKEIDLRLQTPVIGASVCCDVDRILHVFSSLIGNAVTLTPEGGTIDVIAKEREDGVLFSVRHPGAGFERADLARIFDRYRTAANGRGIGLHLTKRFVEAHGGKIWCESEPEKVTTFSFTLPRPPSEQAGPRS